MANYLSQLIKLIIPYGNDTKENCVFFINKALESSILGGGDDYELLFTAKAEYMLRINSIAAELGLPLTKIGRVTQGAGVEVCDGNGGLKKDFQKGFDHFATRK